jgi:hypothetical protein
MNVKMKLLAVLATLALALFITGIACTLRAQSGTVIRSNTFVFNANSAIISWDGSDPASPPYPYNMGAVSLQHSFGGGYGSAILVPFQLGYLNDGDLSPCDTIQWDAKVWTSGDGTHDGDTYTQAGKTSCPYFTGEYGTYNDSNNKLDGFSVVASYVHTKYTTCGRYSCKTSFKDVLEGGTGTITETAIN